MKKKGLISKMKLFLGLCFLKPSDFIDSKSKCRISSLDLVYFPIYLFKSVYIFLNYTVYNQNSLLYLFSLCVSLISSLFTVHLSMICFQIHSMSCLPIFFFLFLSSYLSLSITKANTHQISFLTGPASF